MKKIKIASIASVLLLTSTHLCAMMVTIDEKEANYSKKTPLQQKKINDISLRKQKSGNSEEQEISNNSYVFKPLFYCGDVLLSWENIAHMWKKLLGWNQTSVQSQGANIYLLPNELFWHIADFLGSIDILKLSGTCKKFRQVFNEDYWITYLSKIPKAHSYLILNSPLSPMLHRKAFFSHLWYSEGQINLAAKLGHPEALLLCEYGPSGAYIGKDQYFCPSGLIRHISGKIDSEKTDKLKEAERKKARADMERNEMLKKRQEQMVKFGSRWQGNFYMN